MTELIKSLSVFIENSKVAFGMDQCTHLDSKGKPDFCRLSYACRDCSMSLVNKKLISTKLNEQISDNLD